jgi:hypothetical protein
MFKAINELAELYERGAWSRDDYFHRLTLLVPDLPIGELLRELPTSDRDEFVSWLRETYDNDVPPESFVSIGYRDDPALDRTRIDGLRSWLRANRGEVPRR